MKSLPAVSLPGPAEDSDCINELQNIEFHLTYPGQARTKKVENADYADYTDLH